MTSIQEKRSSYVHRLSVVVGLLSVIFLACGELDVFAKPAARVIQIEFFWSKDCPHCESVKALLGDLQKSYGIKVKEFDIDQEAHYTAFNRLQSSHKKRDLSVPLIVMGKDLLVGESDIKSRLEEKIRSLISTTPPGSSTGGTAKKTGKTDRAATMGAGSKTKALPDSTKEDWGKMKMTIDEFF
jgi:glutaredoxin